MRYFELLSENEETSATDSDKRKQTKVYFHVTTQSRLKLIRERGIEPNHHRRWKTGFGNKLGERGYIYLISDFDSAVQWAYKQQWEHFNGKMPAKSPYVIISVRVDPDALEPDPNPDNRLYKNSFFQMQDTIVPEDIMKVIPLTKELIQKVLKLGESASLRTFGGGYSLRRCVKALLDRGWHECDSAPGLFLNKDNPDYRIELDVNDRQGPFTVFRDNHVINVTDLPPYPQTIAFKDGAGNIPERDPWDF